MVAGTQPFVAISSAKAMAEMRRRLAKAGVAHAAEYRLHDFRRGHADDLARSGASLCTLLRAGDWKSAAFLAYLDTEDLAARAVLEASWQASDTEDEA